MVGLFVKVYLNTHNLQETVFWIFVCSFYCLFKRVPLKMYLWHTCVLWVFKKVYRISFNISSGVISNRFASAIRLVVLGSEEPVSLS